MRSGPTPRPFSLSKHLYALLCVVVCAAALALTPAPASAYDDGALSKAGPGAALASADLGKANLSNANLVGADLTGAKLGKANLTGARYDASTRWPRRFKVPRSAVDVGAGGGAAPAPSPSPAPAASAGASAYALTPADVTAVITAATPQINACLAGSDVQGALNMHWKILGSGAVSDVTIASTQHAQTQGGACVKGVIAALSFPAHNKPAVPISNFPFKSP
jgi:hypothetical protein